MSDQNGGGGGDVVRGNGVVPGMSPGVQMPDVPKDARPATASDFARVMRERNNAAGQQGGQQQPPSQRGRLASFSERLEQSQQAPVGPNDPKPGKIDPHGQSKGDPSSQPRPANMGSDSPAQGQPGQQPAGEPGVDGSETDPQLADGSETDPEVAALDDMAALAKFREWDESEMFPDELASKLHEVKVNGRIQHVDTNELRQGYMRGGDYRRQTAEAQTIVQQARQQQQSMQRHFEEVRDPQAMLNIYERQGYGDTLYQMATIIAERDRGDRRQIHAAMIAEAQKIGAHDINDHRVVKVGKDIEARIKSQRETDHRNARLEYEREQFNAQRQAEQQDREAQQNGAVLKRQVDQLMPLAFRANKIVNNERNEALFKQALGRVISVHGLDQGNITRKMCMDAASDMLDELDRLAMARNGQPGGQMTPEQWQQAQQRQGTGRALPANRLGLGGGKPNGALAGKQRGSVRDLENQVRDNRMRQR